MFRAIAGWIAGDAVLLVPAFACFASAAVCAVMAVLI